MILGEGGEQSQAPLPPEELTDGPISHIHMFRQGIGGEEGGEIGREGGRKRDGEGRGGESGRKSMGRRRVGKEIKS